MSKRYNLPLGILGFLSVDRIKGTLLTLSGRLYHEPTSRPLGGFELSVIPRWQLGLGVTTERSERETVLSLQVPGASLWLTLPFAAGRATSWKGDEVRWEVRAYQTEDEGLPDVVIGWCLGRNPNHWSSDDPQQWRDGSWNLSRMFGGVGYQLIPIEVVDTVAPLPEGLCKVRVQLGRSVRFWNRLPFLQNRRTYATVTLLEPPVVTGNGHEGWHPAYSDLFECNVAASTPGEAVGAFVGRVLRYREREGLPFMPEASINVVATADGAAADAVVAAFKQVLTQASPCDSIRLNLEVTDDGKLQVEGAEQVKP